MLKLSAWYDRYQTNHKDAVDMTIVLQDYWEINLGRDIRALPEHDPALLAEVSDRLHHEIGKNENSRLVQQILEADRLKGYKEVITALALLAPELHQ